MGDEGENIMKKYLGLRKLNVCFFLGVIFHQIQAMQAPQGVGLATAGAAAPVVVPVAQMQPTQMVPSPVIAAQQNVPSPVIFPQPSMQPAPIVSPQLSATPSMAPTPQPVFPINQPPAAFGSMAPPMAAQAVPSEEKNIYLNFENTDLTSFIDYMAELKKLNILPDKSLEGSKISLTIREPLSIEGAWNIFLTVLEMSGFSIIKVGELNRIVPRDKKLMQPLPAYINVPYTALPDSDMMVRYVVFLTNISVADVEPILGSMLSNPNVLLAQKDMNAFIITDKSYNIKAAVKLIQELDQTGMPEEVIVLRLKRANAADVETLLNALIKKPEGNPLARLLGKAAEGGAEYFSSTTRVVREERTNSLILMGNKKSIEKIVNFITTNIDGQISEAKSPIHIYELQNIDAAQVRDILKEVTAIPESATGAAAGKFGSIRGGVKYFKGMNFQVDKDGNRLIVSCLDKQDWRLVKKTIQDLDKPQPQVAIESLLVTITGDDMKQLGGSIRNKKHGQIGTNIDMQSAALGVNPSLETGTDGKPISLLGNMLTQLASTKGQTLLTFGDTSKTNGVWGVFSMIKAQTNASVLSQPFITVANKTTAKIDVGTDQRIVSETVGGSTGTATTKGYSTDKASTSLEITPQINLDGVIRLKVRVEITEFENPDATKKSTKIVDTNVSVADGQVLVLGGFVKTKVTEAKQKSPFADIPILGWFLGKNQTREIVKEYIFVFLAPTIIKPRQQPGMQLYTKMKLHQATEDIEASVETRRTLDPIHNWFFNHDKENYSHKVIDFANARYQPTTVDIKNDVYYRSQIKDDEEQEERMRLRIDDKPLAAGPSLGLATMQSTVSSSTPALSDTTAKVMQITPSIVPLAKTAEVSMPPNIQSKPVAPAFVQAAQMPRPVAPTLVPPSPAPALAPAQPAAVAPTPGAISMPKALVPPAAVQQADDAGIGALKNILDLGPVPQQREQLLQEQKNINTDMGKRNVLKDFLSAHRKSVSDMEVANIEKSRA